MGGKEALEMESSIIFPLWTNQRNKSRDEGVGKEIGLAGHLFLLAQKALAKDASFWCFLWQVWRVIGEAKKIRCSFEVSSSSTRIWVEDCLFLGWYQVFLGTTFVIEMSTVSVIWRGETSKTMGFGIKEK